MSESELVEFVVPAFQEAGSFPGTPDRLLSVYVVAVDAVAARRGSWKSSPQSGSSVVSSWP